MTARARKKARSDPPDVSPRIAVQLERGAARRGRSLAGLENLLEQAKHPPDALRLESLFPSVEPKKLADLIERARRLDPDYEPGEFSSWFQIVCPERLVPEELTLAIRGLQGVRTAYVLRPGPPPVVTPADDPRNANQGYLDAAPDGIDARFAWGFVGGDGAGIGFVDMEQGWNLSHDDLAAAGIGLISGVSSYYFSHGTSVLGEIRMVDNTEGGVGVAPASVGRVISQWRTTASYNTADAILDAAANMAFGDVLLLEAQEYDPVAATYYWPVEIADATYDAIRLASALGIVVVEAGCNGGYDLDAYANLAGLSIFDRSSPDFRDSGAIMVGAASATAPHTRLGFSNFGSRIDCYAWGESIDTTSTNGSGTDNTLYTTIFGGTSGASPIIVGAALIVQGIAEASLGYRFSPRALRLILTTGGTASNDPTADRIGVMPDLNAILTGGTINAVPDVYLRDYVGDSGDPTTGSVSRSPDIIVRQSAVANPQVDFGPGSGTENDPTLSDDVATGADHHVYVRVFNRGGSPANAVEVDVYWSPPSTLVSPHLWNTIGTTTLPVVPTGDVLTVSNEILWPAASLPAQGHYCFVGVAGNAQDPKPGPAAFASFDNFLTYIRNNNNVVWRNFDVVAGPPPAGSPPGFYRLPFVISGAFDRGRRFGVESIGRLPRGSRVLLDVPLWLAQTLRPRHCELDVDEETGLARVPLHPTGVQRLGTALLRAKAAARCCLLVRLPEEESACPYEIAVRQLYEDEEVGRVTWRLGGPAPKGAR